MTVTGGVAAPSGAPDGEVVRRLVRDSTTVYGPDHRETLQARCGLARQVGAAGDPGQALVIAREADAAATAALGADDRTTLSARFEVAVWTREMEGAAAGAECFGELIRQAKRLDPPPQSLIADSMLNLAGSLSDVGDHARAVQAITDAISLCQQVWGAAHARVLGMRLTQAHVAGSSGDPQTAADLSGRLAHDCAEILGGSHLTTLQARHAVARWTAAAGDREAAEQYYVALSADVARVLGDDHWATQRCRLELAEIKKA